MSLPNWLPANAWLVSLGTMLSIDWDQAARLATSLVPAGPKAEPAEIAALVAELRAVSTDALSAASQASGLDTPSEVETRVVDRTGIIRGNIASARRIFAATDQPTGLGKVGAASRGATLGAVLALLGSKILGQFDPFVHPPRLLLVAPNILAAERQLRLNPRDFRTWVCLHEQTHRLQFSTAPWLGSELLAQARILLEAEGQSEGLWRSLAQAAQRWRERRPGQATSLSMAAVLTSEEGSKALDRVTAIMSLLEGHADVMMDRAAPGLITSLPVLRSRFEARRKNSGSTLLYKLIGMDAKLAQYADGARFCRQVLAEGGLETLNLAFSELAALPTVTELHSPKTWMARVSIG